MGKFLVRFIMLFRPLWKQLGVQPDHLEVILLTKVMMDGRRTGAFSQGMASSKKKNLDVLSMLFFFMVGLFSMMMLIVFELPVTGIALFLTVWLVIIMMTLITDFTDVLIDVKENYILLPRPVNDQTLTISRLLHIFIYLFQLLIAFSIGPIIYMIVVHGWLSGLLLLAQILACVFFAIFFVNVLYMTILRYTDMQRFKEIINYFQIAFIIIILTAYYILPNVIDLENFKDLNILESGVRHLMPSAWIASWWSVLMEGNMQGGVIVLALLGALVPLICLWLVVTVFSKNFSQKLIGLGQGSSNLKVVEEPIAKPKRKPWMEFWKSKLTKTAAEGAGFESVWLLTARSRMYKLKTYPSFGFIPALFIYLALKGDEPLQEKWDLLVQGHSYVLLIYIALLGASAPIQNMQYSNKHKASWLYYAMPIPTPGILLRGAVKACMIKFVFPILVFMCAICLAIWGIQTVDDIHLGIANIILFCLLMSKQFIQHMPFSNPWENQNKGGNLGRVMLVMSVIGIMGAIHWLLAGRTPFVLLWALISFGLCWYLFKSFEKVGWDKIK